MNDIPELLIVSGPNGSGKTTLAEEYAEKLGYPYLGADKIAARLAPEDPLSQRIEASRQFSGELREAISARKSVVVESTLSGRSFVNTIERARENSMSISVMHLFVNSADICVARVNERVQKGGHDVPEADIRRRFTRSAANFWKLYRPLCDRWGLLYNSDIGPELIAQGESAIQTIEDEILFNVFQMIVQSNA